MRVKCLAQEHTPARATTQTARLKSGALAIGHRASQQDWKETRDQHVKMDN